MKTMIELISILISLIYEHENKYFHIEKINRCNNMNDVIVPALIVTGMAVRETPLIMKYGIDEHIKATHIGILKKSKIKSNNKTI